MVIKRIKLIILALAIGLSGQIKSDWQDWLDWGTQAAYVGTQAGILLGADNIAQNCSTAYDYSTAAKQALYTAQTCVDGTSVPEKVCNLSAMYYDCNPAMNQIDPTLGSISEGLSTAHQAYAIAEDTVSRESSEIDFTKISPLTAEYLAGAGIMHCLGGYLPACCSTAACSVGALHAVEACTPACAAFTLPVTQTITLGLVAKAAILGKFALGAGALYAGHKAAEHVCPEQYKKVKSACTYAYDKVKSVVSDNPILKYGAVGCTVLYKVLSAAQERNLQDMQEVTEKISLQKNTQIVAEQSGMFSNLLHYFVERQKMTSV